MADPKKRTGTIEPYKDAAGKICYAGRVRLADGTRSPRFKVPAKWAYSDERARECVTAAQEKEDRDGKMLARKQAKAAASALAAPAATDAAAPAGETCDAWYGRYFAYQRELGQTDADKKRARWSKWISPFIGPKPMAAVTRNDIEDIRDNFDRAVQAWKKSGGQNGGKTGEAIAGKTAMNAWSALTSSFKAATSSKRRDLRVLDGKPNPCLGVEPPGDRESRKVRRKTFLYPREASALYACADVPIEWREVYAVAAMTYLRPGELRVLTWADVDLDAGHAKITKAWDYTDAKIKTPKTSNGVRNVPIEPSLRPLLTRMRRDADGRARSDGGTDASTRLVVPCLPLFGEDHLAEQFRRHLKLAGVKRTELHESTRTHVQSNFRSGRDSGLTWLALSGLGVDKIMRRAGHDNIQTTMGYLKLAEDLSGDLGAPFGPLPANLIAPQLPSERPSDEASRNSADFGESSSAPDEVPSAVVIHEASANARGGDGMSGFDSLLRHNDLHHASRSSFAISTSRISICLTAAFAFEATSARATSVTATARRGAIARSLVPRNQRGDGLSPSAGARESCRGRARP